jgi:hypothetical protein
VSTSGGVAGSANGGSSGLGGNAGGRGGVAGAGRNGAGTAGAGGEVPVDHPGGEGGGGGLVAAGAGGADAVDCTSLPQPEMLAARLFARGDDPSSLPECTEVLNPERGMFRFRDLRSLGDVQGLRADGYSLIYGKVLLDDYRDRALDAGLLEELADAFAEIRRAGLKVLPRFYYADSGEQPDAPIERVLEHIESLAPLLAAESPAIAALHAGFVGAWGEWHASTNDLTEPTNRKLIFDGLLGALPASRMVLARRPSHKLAAYGGPLDSASAFRGDALSRIGHLNDCFLGSDDDVGTYQLEGEKAYAVVDSAYTAVGGETCAVNPPRSACASAEAELRLHHWSFLNADYHSEVIAGFESEGCLPTIQCRLGYRFALIAQALPESLQPADLLPLRFTFFNDGYARAFNARPAFLVLEGANIQRVELALDLRTFAPETESHVCLNVQLPALTPGQYRVGLTFPDADPELAADPRYALRLSSGTTWEAERGINWLTATLTVREPP